MSVEDKAELAKLKKDIIQSEQRTQASEQRTQASEQRRKEAKEDIERFNRLNKV
jgi:multidrug resistance efflux pump